MFGSESTERAQANDAGAQDGQMIPLTHPTPLDILSNADCEAAASPGLQVCQACTAPPQGLFADK
jgi:hypothetical protein